MRRQLYLLVSLTWGTVYPLNVKIVYILKVVEGAYSIEDIYGMVPWKKRIHIVTVSIQTKFCQ